MQVSTDEYHLPEVVADSVDELAHKCGVKPDSIYSSMSRARTGKTPEKYCYVDIPDEEAENLIWGTDWAVDNGFEIPSKEYRKYLALSKRMENQNGTDS